MRCAISRARSCSTTEVRFDEKAQCARGLGLIDGSLCEDLISIYEARNSIHLHAEIRKGLAWGLELSRLAYYRLELLQEQIRRGLKARGI